MHIKRKIETRLLENLDRDEVIVLVGARQSGKTSLLKKLKADLDSREEITFFINLENTRYLHLLNEAPENLFKLTGNLPDRRVYVFVDEIQYLDNPSNFLKYMYDEYRGKIKLIVTGSSAFFIDQKFKDSLAGRKRLFELKLLDFREFLRFKGCEELVEHFPQIELLTNREIPGLVKDKLDKLFMEFVTFGAYPGAVLEKSDKEKKYLLEELLNSYLAKDVEAEGIKKKEKFFNLLRLLSMQAGSLINMSELGNTLKLSVTAVDNYFFILEKSFQVKRVPPFYSNLRKELTKMPKFYFLDLGIRNMLLDNFDWLELRMDRGICVENLVFKLLHDREDVKKMHFWRTQDKKEVDFIIDGKFALEVKFNGTKFSAGKYRLFCETYPGIPLAVVCYTGPTPHSLSLFDLI
ncbi:MAG: ATP-binding protein [Candidatus Aminicenantes bacterium]|nr:ATP-binding protein [Candidatus Aminicenantes bacterium]